jgi:hypothetical protein
MRHLLVILGYLALAVIWTWPLALGLGGSVIQKGALPVDAGQGVWNLWWARAALTGGENPFVTGYLFYPDGLNLFFQTLSLPNALSVWPVLLWAGPVAAFNAVTLLSFALGGYWAYRVGRALGASAPAALLAGFVFAFTPYHLQRVWSGPMELIAIHWLALYALLLLRALARRTVGSAAAAGLALFVVTLASQYYGLYAAVYTAAHGALAALLAPRPARLPTLAAAAGVGGVWAALLLPSLLLAGGLGDVALEDWYVRQVYHSVALVDLVVPNVRHPLWGEAAAAWQGAVHPFGLEAGAGLGVGVLILGVVALVRRRAAAWPWALLALLMLVLAMGPQIRLTAAESPVPGPFLLLDLVGPFRNSSRPAVFVALMLLPAAVLCAFGFDALASGRGGDRETGRLGDSLRRRRVVSRSLIVALVVFESVVAPWPLTALRAAPETAAMNGDAEAGAVLELPPRLNDSQGLLAQICHGRALMGGYLARLPFYPIVSYPSATRALWLAAAPAPDILALDAAAELASLGVRFVVLDRTQLPRAAQRRLAEWLDAPGIERVSAGEERAVYAVEPGAARPAAVLGAGWYDVESDGARHWRWMGGRAEVTLLAREQAAVALSLRATAFDEPRQLRVRLGDELLTTVEIPAAPYDRLVSLRLLLPPGQTTLTLESDAVPGPDGRQLSLSVSDLRVAPLPTDPAWGAARTLAIPPTLPALSAAPCG